MTQFARPEPPPGGYFTKVPNILLDGTLALPESSLVGFLRFWKLYAYKGGFAGSIRKLASVLHMSHSTIHRIIPTWIEYGLVRKEMRPSEEEIREQMVLVIQKDELWAKNEHASRCTKQECLNLGQCVDGEECPNLTQHCPNLGHSVSEMGHTVSVVGHSVSPVSVKVPPKNNKNSKITLDQLDIPANAGDEQMVFSQEKRKEMEPDNASIPLLRKEPVEVTLNEPTQTDIDTSLSVLSSPSQDKTAARAKNKKKLSEKPKEPEIMLSAEEQAVFDVWCMLPWFRGVPPKLSKHDKELLSQLIVYKPTLKDLLAERHWVEKNNPWYEGKGWSLTFAVKEYPRWMSTLEASSGEPSLRQGGDAPNPPPGSPGYRMTKDPVWIADMERRQQKAHETAMKNRAERLEREAKAREARERAAQQPIALYGRAIS